MWVRMRVSSYIISCLLILDYVHYPPTASALKVSRVHVKTNKHQLLLVDDLDLHNKHIWFSQGQVTTQSVQGIVLFSFPLKRKIFVWHRFYLIISIICRDEYLSLYKNRFFYINILAAYKLVQKRTNKI